MTPANQEALNALIKRWPPPGPRVLELGAIPETAREFRKAMPGCDYVGIDLVADEDGKQEGIVRGDANELPFGDGSFDAIVTSSMFEHNPRFWLAVAEARRVLRPGGRIYVSVPGYFDRMGRAARIARRIRNLANDRGFHRIARIASRAVVTRTYPFHMGPADYFRFSAQAMREVLLDGFAVLDVRLVGRPPNIHGVGEL